MAKDQSIENLKFDKRLIEWNLNNNQISNAELKSHIETLPDLKEKSEPMSLTDKNSPNEPH